MLELNKIYNMDCLEGMKYIDDKSIDMILCDLPYGTTACKWDVVIPLKPLWEQYERIIKDNRAIVLFGSQPFTSALVMSNPNLFKYEWIWNKRNISNPFLAKYQPLKQHESILVFGKGTVNYYPIITPRDKVRKYKDKYGGGEAFNKKGTGEKEYTLKFKYPKSILEYTNAIQKGKLHPTQKPVALCEYLIKTYSNEGDLVLDNCIGSGTTAIACINTNRNYIGFELDKEYYEIAKNRINKHILDNNLQDKYNLIT